MIVPPSGLAWRAVAVVALLAAVWWHGYDAGRDSRAEEVSALTAVGAEQTRRARETTQEVWNAQQAYVTGWRRARAESEPDWLRLKASSTSRVPTVCPKPGSADADQRNGMETAGGTGDRDLLPALVGALETGERLEATLALCQQELRQCAGMR